MTVRVRVMVCVRVRVHVRGVMDVAVWVVGYWLGSCSETKFARNSGIMNLF